MRFATAQTASAALQRTALGRRERWHRAKRMRLLYVALLPGVALLFVFNYLPIYGIIAAFKDYRFTLGFLGSEWNDFHHFKILFGHPFFWRIFRNTVIISVLRIAFGFPAPIILALLINELANQKFKRVVQSVSYLPYFFSWVVLAGILVEILSPQRGIVGYLFGLVDQPAPLLLTDPGLFRPMLVATGIWQEVGWGSVIYLAAMAAIDPELYETGRIDGANRLQQAVHITLPSLLPVVTILFILKLGTVLNAGFDQIFNLYSPLVYEVADIIDTYVYRQGIIERQYGFTTAVGLFKNVIGVALIVGSNSVIKRYSEYGLW